MMKFTNLTIFAALVLLALPLAASAAYDLSWYTVDGGGAMSSAGGTYELSGTIGQPDAGVPLTGGNFSLTGGFWAAAAQRPPCHGDITGDHLINLDDLAQMLAHYGITNGALYEDGDLDGDGDVDLSDLAELLGIYGHPCP
jgi:hypothetical protein